MPMKLAYLFLVPDGDADAYNAVVETPSVSMSVFAVKNYAEAEKTAKMLVEQGVQAIELCSAFGNEGLARVSRAAQGKAAVGAIRFDRGPLLGGKSGDDIFE